MAVPSTRAQFMDSRPRFAERSIDNSVGWGGKVDHRYPAHQHFDSKRA